MRPCNDDTKPTRLKGGSVARPVLAGGDVATYVSFRAGRIGNPSYGWPRQDVAEPTAIPTPTD